MIKLRNFFISILKKLGVRETGETAVRLFILQMITLLISFIPSILISRTLGPAMKGRLDLFNLLNSYITEFGLLGFGSGLLFYQMKKEYSLSTIHGTGIVFSVIMAFAVSVFSIITFDLWQGIFTGLPKEYIILAFVIAPFLFYKLLMGNILLGMNKAIFNYILALVLGVSDAILIFILFMTGRLYYTAVIYLLSIESVLITCVGMLYIRKKSTSFSFDLLLLKKALKYGLVTYIGAMANSLLFKIDLLFLNYYKGNEAVGIYAVAVRWAEMLFLLDSAIGSATLYKVGNLKREEARMLTLRTMRLQMLISGIMGVGLLFASYPIIYIIYGKAYIGATLPLIILLPGILIWSVGKLMSQYIVYKLGKAYWCTIASILGSMLNLVLNSILIPQYNLCGAALASSISYIAVTSVSVFMGLYGPKVKPD